MESNQNHENMDVVRKLMDNAEQVRLGGDLKTGVPINYTSLDGNKFEGTVVFKRPTMQDYMKIGALKSEYLRQAGVVDVRLVDLVVKEMAQILALFKVVIVKCPSWLMDVDKIQEADVLYHVYEKYEAWEDSFRKRDTTEPTEPSGATE